MKGRISDSYWLNRQNLRYARSRSCYLSEEVVVEQALARTMNYDAWSKALLFAQPEWQHWFEAGFVADIQAPWRTRSIYGSFAGFGRRSHHNGARDVRRTILVRSRAPRRATEHLGGAASQIQESAQES